MASTAISPKDVVNALQQLNDEQAKELFFQLEVPLHILDGITDNYRGNMRKIHYVQAWFDQEVRANWEKIVAGLRQIGLKVLADRLASEYCPSAAVSSTPDTNTPPASAPEENNPETSPSGPSPSPVASPLSPSDRVSQVRVEIDQLSDTFSDLMSNTRDEMCTRERVDPSFLKKFRDRLLDLPVAQKSPHAKFFDEKLDDFLMAKNMDKIFAILRRHSNYRNYAVLREVVGRFCEAHVLQRRMQNYCDSLEKFEKATFIDVYLKAIEASEVLASEFTKMTVKINKPASECTLHEVRKLKEKIAERASLQPYSMYIEEESIGSVQLKLGFPASCVGWILGVLTPEFLATHLLSDVVLDQQHLSILDKDLNHELRVAVKSGDVVGVASLLNSGAIQTVDDDSTTPLDLACAQSHLQVVRLLTSRGADLDFRNWWGVTALMFAVAYGGSDVVAELLSLGADINSQDNVGDSVMIIATIHECPALRELVRAGSDPNLQNQEGLTPLMIAARRGRTDITNILLEGEHIDLDIQENTGGWSALHFSAENGDSSTTYALIKAGANVHLKDKNGWTALEIAEVKSADGEATIIPEWSEDYMLEYRGGRDYGIVIELLRGNLMEPVTPPTHHGIKSQNGGIKALVGGKGLMKQREIIEMIGRETPPTEKRPPDNHTHDSTIV